MCGYYTSDVTAARETRSPVTLYVLEVRLRMECAVKDTEKRSRPTDTSKEQDPGGLVRPQLKPEQFNAAT